MRDGPVDGPPKHVIGVVVHTEHEAAVDHDPERMQAPGHGRVVTPEILALQASFEIARGQRLEADEQAAKPSLGGPFD